MPIDPLDETAAESIRPGKMAAGAPLGGFALLEVLGEGGMGVVWSAHDPNLDRRIAIKVLRRVGGAPELRMRLLREARAMARLKHPNVLTVYEVGTEGERDYIAMELVDGGTLAAWLETKPPRDEIIAALLAAGRGLAAAHAAGLVHRDFKPHNVLRSHGGRVVVTDFGLARGLADGSRTSSVDPSDSHLLDSPLTQTGTLVGTPAYMAPEQYTGRPPDPRTDQFSFCVTAWQALTGVRPYGGASLEEIFKAIHLGLDRVPADLPPRVRAVLARGLDADPDRRWTDLDSLLDALAAAVRPRRWPWIVGGAFGVAAIAIAIAAATAGSKRSQPEASPSPAIACEPSDAALARAWSPALNARFVGKVGDDRVRARLAGIFDRYRASWVLAYDETCKRPQAARLNCLLGARDRLGLAVELLDDADRATLAAFDPFTALPSLVSCAADVPPTAAKLPDDHRALLGVTRAILALRAVPANELEAAARELEASARATGWPPVVPQAVLAAGEALLRAGRIDQARATFKRVRTLDGRSSRFVAETDLGLLATSVAQLEAPHVDDALDPKAAPAMHKELRAALDQAARTVAATGNDPELVGRLAVLEATILRGLGQGHRAPRALRDALVRVQDAHKAFELDPVRAADAAALEAQLDLDLDAVDDAVFVARTAAAALERDELAPPPRLDAIRDELARMRGDDVELHARLDRRADPPHSTGALHGGRVVDDAGHPVAGARVIAWTGELHGDPARAFTDPRAVHGEIATTRADGGFEIHAEPGAAIVAEHGDLRSAPQVLGAGRVVLGLAPTTVALGMVAGRELVGVDAVARYAVGSAAWFIHAPIAKDRAFHIAGLAPGAYTTGAIGPACDATRRVFAPRVAWSSGQNLDVIAHVPSDLHADVSAWVLFGGSPVPQTRAALEAIATSTFEVATLHAIGADATDVGRAHYKVGDRHALFCGHPDGAYLVCVGSTADEAVACVPATIRDGAAGRVAPVAIELR